jgi:hypothetical protein
MGIFINQSSIFVTLVILVSAACMALLLSKQDHLPMIGRRQLCKNVLEIVHSEEKNRNFNALALAGLINDVSDISESTVDFLVGITCNLQAPVHVMSASGKDALLRAYHDRVTSCGVSDFCADFSVIDQDPDTIEMFPNRVDRLAFIREQQRAELSSLYGGNDSTGDLTDNDFVIVFDLDLQKVPSMRDIEATMEHLVTKHTNLDVVCANGMFSSIDETYDTYATILEGDSWLLGEELNLGPDDQKVTQNSELMIFEENVAESLHEKKDHEVKMLAVKSCFGGLAIYRAKVWLDAACHYDDKVDAVTNSHLLKYRSIIDERVCEHVVFHDCLQKHHTNLQMSVAQNLVALYHDAESFTAIDGKAAFRAHRRAGYGDICHERCGKNNDKFVLCHVPSGDYSKAKTLCIDAGGVLAHLTNHGDFCGPC